MIGTPVGEFHDVSVAADSAGILMGFLDPRAVSGLDATQRQTAVLNQFESLFQAVANAYWIIRTICGSPGPLTQSQRQAITH